MQQQTKIIIFLISLFFLSSVFLFFINDKYLNSEGQKNYWLIYFVEPKGTNLDFVIENHSPQNIFQYKVLNGTEVIKSENINVSKGETKNIKLSGENLDKKITVEISSGAEKKEIYKN